MRYNDEEKAQAQKTGKVMPRHLEHFVKRAVKFLGCDTARISQACGVLFLIIGTKRNTMKDRIEGQTQGQWLKDGEPFDFDYISEHVIAKGKDLAELWASVKWYKKVQKEG